MTGLFTPPAKRSFNVKTRKGLDAKVRKLEEEGYEVSLVVLTRKNDSSYDHMTVSITKSPKEAK